MAVKKRPDIRFLYNIKAVIYDQNWLKKTGNFEIYYMYRGIKKKGELRYDETLILPKMFGQEFSKTLGHGHSKSFQEVYQVLKGKAIFLLQKYREGKIEDIYAVKAKTGQIIIVPLYYGHVTINPTRKELKISNWVSEKCENSYSLFKKFRGACYYYTKKGWIKNKNYKKVPKLRFKKPLKKLPKNLDFLKG